MFSFNISKNSLISAFVLFSGILASLFIIQSAQAQVSRNSSFSFKKDSNNLFTITVRDPQGIKEFSLQPPGKFSYGGIITGCPTSRRIDNVIFDDPNDFTPAMNAYVVDCAGNQDDLRIPAPKDGVAAAVRVGVEEEPAKTEVKKEAEKVAETAKPESLPKSNIKYPVAELGNCGSEFECRVYCDNAANIGKCLDYAEKNNLIKSEEIERGRKFKKVLDSGGTPGGCDSQQTCEVYCNDVENIDKCLAFGEAQGFLKDKELQEAKKIHEIIKTGRKLPGDCRNKTACEAYCKNPQNIEACIAFAEESGFISGEELAQAKKFLPLIQKGETPGACKSKEECEVYCEMEGNIDECLDFAIKHDVIPKEERERVEAFKKAGGVGPGGCKGRQCQAFCENPDNQKACFQWAKENGILREEDLRRMEQGKSQILQAIQGSTPEVQKCFAEVLGPGGLEKLQSGEFFGGPELGEKIRVCFQQTAEQIKGGGFEGSIDFPEGFVGPGGCRTYDECKVYCDQQPTPGECKSFQVPGFQGGPPQGFEGGSPADGFSGGGATGGEFPGGGATGGEFPGGPGGLPSAEGCVPPPSGLVSWWRAEGNASDSADGNNGTLVGGAAIESGKVGSAFKLNGSGGYVRIGNSGNLNFGTGPFSLEAWFNWAGGSSVNNIIRKSNYPASGPGSGYWLRAGAGTLEFSVGATTGPEGQTFITAPVSTGVWHYAVAVKESSGTAKLYVDGQSAGTVVRQSPETQSTSESAFALGAWPDQNSEFFSGLIDEASVYNRALSESEVRALFNAGSAGKCASSGSGRQYQQGLPSGFVPSPEDIQKIQEQYQQGGSNFGPSPEDIQKIKEQYEQQFQQQYQQQYQNYNPSSYPSSYPQ